MVNVPNRMFTSLEEFDSIVSDKWSSLVAVEEYLNGAGQAKKEAYQNILWFCGFMDDLKDLYDSGEIQGLLELNGKHPEYYKTVKMVIRALKKSLDIKD